MIKKTFPFLFLLSPFLSFSQSISTYLNHAKNDVARGEYYEAAANYLNALKIDSLNQKANLEYGLLNTQYINNPGIAGPYLLRAEKLSTKDTMSELILGLAQYYQSTGQYPKAVTYFNRVFSKIEKGSEKTALENMLAQSVASCQYAEQPTPQAVFKRLKITNAGSGVNTIFPEHSPVTMKDGSVLLFTSRRAKNVGGKIDDFDGNYFEDMFIARLDKKDNSFKNGHGFSNEDSEIKGLSNTKDHDAVVILTKSGDRFFVCRKNKIYESTWKNNEWTVPTLMNEAINPPNAYQSHLTISTDAKTIYFSSDRTGGFGGLDIYKSELQSDGNWGTPVNLGPTINTKMDDDSPFLNYAGTMLYYASKGLPGYGGFDIYRCKQNGSVWDKPQNMGSLFNSSGDDTHLTFNKDESEGYFSSARAGGFGDMDIYVVGYKGPFEDFVADAEGRLKISMPDTFYVNEKVTLGTTSNVLPPSVFQRYYWQVNDSVLAADGEIATHTFSKPGEIRIRVVGHTKDNDFIGYEQKVTVAERKVITVATNTTTVATNTTSITDTGGSSTGMDNIYFGFNQRIINTEARAALLRNLKYLKEHPEVTISVAAYCDSRGPTSYNETLSERRAKNVVWYLCKHGLDKKRVKEVNWFGEKDPLNKCIDGTPCTSGEYKINRRVEFKVEGGK